MTEKLTPKNYALRIEKLKKLPNRAAMHRYCKTHGWHVGPMRNDHFDVISSIKIQGLKAV
ncbi:hypothetical protein [Vibrio algivorus]|uniref:Uncharacterized protein n=1 Tax=Vibrio algivorus TaxID=1667024 RepID=A0ABQ6EL57_9VIBR|nr:hypothetical protein [Vibrio algivorus]GLT13863.1 hypothetical protein GCM10007931_08370 [Vibrio algivorus]